MFYKVRAFIGNLFPTQELIPLGNNLISFQFPTSLPNFHCPSQISTDPPTATGLPEGALGKLRIHKSGKMTLRIGDIEYNV